MRFVVVQALDQALDIALRLALNIPFQEVLAFPKLSKAYFAFFEVLFRNHISAVLSLSTPIFLQVWWLTVDIHIPWWLV